MAEVLNFPDGNYRFVRGVYPYSAGVAALPGFALERARFRKPVPVAEGFQAIAAHLARLGRPKTAFAACELRSPAPFTEEGFVAFNRLYVGTLTEWGIFRDGINPVARSNVCPELQKPAEPSFYAFTYTVPAAGGEPESFVVAGSGEAPEGHANYRDHIVARGDASPAGLTTKARWVLGEMERRLAALGKGWADVTETQAYTVHDLHPFLGTEIVARGAAAGGLTWHYARPPVVELEYEMDCRGLAQEIVI